MFYYIYQITNLVNNKIYVGVHKTQNVDDGYMGSGKVIKAAIVKYGLENFKKDILEFFENAELMYAKEKEVVTEEFLARDDVYNLRRGGTGGFDWINANGLHGFANKQTAQRGRDSANDSLLRKYGKGWKTVLAQKAQKSRTQNTYKKANATKIKNNTFPKTTDSSRLRTPEAQRKKRITFEENKHQQGEKNSQFGTCWIWHELIGNKKCMKKLLPEYIEQGWIKGRKLLYIKRLKDLE